MCAWSILGHLDLCTTRLMSLQEWLSSNNSTSPRIRSGVIEVFFFFQVTFSVLIPS